VIAIRSGGWHSLALTSAGKVVAWGANTGTNTNVDCSQSTVPAGLSNVVQIAAGSVNSLVLIGTAPPVTKALLTVPAFGTNGFTVSVPSRNGRVYRLEYVTSLTSTNWQGLPLVAGNGGFLQLSDSTATGAARFYRVRQW
jgi:hypothetical protein